jgi:hypothetical protein
MLPSHPLPRRWLMPACSAAAALLTGCAAAPGSGREAAVTQAVASPLADLNIVRAEIPPALAAALKAPYALPADRSCTGLTADVSALDAVLGTDLDAPPSPHNPGLVERGTDALGNAAVGAVRSAAENVVPFRGWVRRLSGAERYSREVAAAIAAGTLRRAYLKGLGQATGCAPPAAPRQPG